MQSTKPVSYPNPVQSIDGGYELVRRITRPCIKLNSVSRADVVLSRQNLYLLFPLVIYGDLLDNKLRVGRQAQPMRDQFDRPGIALCGVERIPVIVALGIELAGDFTGGE